MAVDEAILESYVRDQTTATVTLRLYGWQPAAVSLGRGQPAAGTFDPRFLRESRIGLVRRPTGGLAVLHDDERTYSVCARLREAPFSGRVLETYRRIAVALEAALVSLGVPARARSPASAAGPRTQRTSCFAVASAHEIVVTGSKLVGSAQLRRGGAFLQHGSILLRADSRRISRALAGAPAGNLTDLRTACGREVHWPEVDEALVAALEHELRLPAEPGRLDDRELARATRLYSWKYSSLAWTVAGRLGARETRWGPPLP